MLMSIFQSALFAVVSFLASVAGAICGIGGGVVIKPVLDMFGWASISAISFLSGCTVLSMSCYTVGKSVIAGEKTVDLKLGTPLAVGAALGGAAGKQLFHLIKSMSANPNMVGGIQSACLAFITALTLIYSLNKSKIKTRQVASAAVCVIIGLILGILSSFLGIGGGPINLVFLYYFFRMETKIAAANSLYIILFSQITSLVTTLITRTVPEFPPITLVFMVIGGILGGMAGRAVNKKIDSHAVERLFLYLMGAIILISIGNAWKYLSVPQ